MKDKELWAETAEISLLTLGLIIVSIKMRKQLKQYKEWLTFCSEQLDLSIETYNKVIEKHENESS